jgi:hypothetical protein
MIQAPELLLTFEPDL